jgi:uncharacterized OsmC-like protein
MAVGSMTAENMAVEGIDAPQIAAFNRQYSGAPANFMLGIEARSIWEGRGLGNLGKVGPWSMGGQVMEKPTRDFSVQIGSWREVGDALGVIGADDRIEPIEAAMLGLASCVTEAITLTCAAQGVPLKGLEAKAHVDVDPGPITGAREPSDWDTNLKSVRVDVTVKGDLSAKDRAVVEHGAKRSPVHYMFSRTGLLETEFHYEG